MTSDLTPSELGELVAIVTHQIAAAEIFLERLAEQKLPTVEPRARLEKAKTILDKLKLRLTIAAELDAFAADLATEKASGAPLADLCAVVPIDAMKALGIAARHLAVAAMAHSDSTVTPQLRHAAIIYVHELTRAYALDARGTLSLALALALENRGPDDV